MGLLAIAFWQPLGSKLMRNLNALPFKTATRMINQPQLPLPVFCELLPFSIG